MGKDIQFNEHELRSAEYIAWSTVEAPSSPDVRERQKHLIAPRSAYDSFWDVATID